MDRTPILLMNDITSAILKGKLIMTNNGALPVDTDLVIIGAGLAGHAAALQAAESGCQVLLIEKTDSCGGSTVLSSGSFAFAGTQAQRNAGHEDSGENLADDIRSASGNLADPELVDLYVQEQARAFSWLHEHGVEFHQVSLSSNQAVPRTHPTDPQQLMNALHKCVQEQKNILYLPNAAARSLVVDNSHRVNGAVVDIGGQAASVKAHKGVLLASGGFSRNKNLIAKFAPKMSRALLLGGAGNTGDGLLMAWQLGADLVDVAYINGTFGISLNHYPENRPPEAEEALLRVAVYRGAIAVNLNAERFADESLSYKKLGEVCLEQPNAVGFQLWDQKIMDQSMPAPTAADFEGALAKGLVKKANDVRELARAVNLDPDKLEATVNRYNEDVLKGRDSVFGRTHLGRTNVGKGWGQMVPINKPPFYIYPCTTAVLATYCGLRVTRDMEVVSVTGKLIDGLYAAGEIVGGFHGSGYMSGSSLSKSVIFGRVAANTALNKEPM